MITLEWLGVIGGNGAIEIAVLEYHVIYFPVVYV
jgi:hypothetical protein